MSECCTPFCSYLSHSLIWSIADWMQRHEQIWQNSIRIRQWTLMHCIRSGMEFRSSTSLWEGKDVYISHIDWTSNWFCDFGYFCLLFCCSSDIESVVSEANGKRYANCHFSLGLQLSFSYSILHLISSEALNWRPQWLISICIWTLLPLSSTPIWCAASEPAQLELVLSINVRTQWQRRTLQKDMMFLRRSGMLTMGNNILPNCTLGWPLFT